MCHSAATFGWLCVETPCGCLGIRRSMAATFWWLCVETLLQRPAARCFWQPPSGGCVLKQRGGGSLLYAALAATFGWLCVETPCGCLGIRRSMAATFWWLCVETLLQRPAARCFWQPPSGGCVLKQRGGGSLLYAALAATFGWLCVETPCPQAAMPCAIRQPPSGGCVLKRYRWARWHYWALQPPSGGCVLKRYRWARWHYWALQPPSGGCVLKPAD